MCGILAYLNFSDSNKITTEALERSLEVINYRGPNNTGTLSFQEKEITKVFLGHKRLSIIDLTEAGNQPFTIQEMYHIVFNGEIYNYVELREDLISKGYRFVTGSDTEVLLTLYIESGTSRFGELNGMWSFVIYDEVKKVSVISRDRFGIKPVYILEKDEQILFASEIKQLLPFIDTKKLNVKVLSDYLYSYALDIDDNTFFKEITKLPACTNLIIDLNTNARRYENYWRFSSIDLDRNHPSALQEQYRDLLISSIKLRLRSDVKIGNTLSGGLDSSSIAVLAHDLSGGNIYNYSIISNDENISEEKYVNDLIAYNGINVKKINFDNTNPWDLLDTVIYHHDEPILSLSTVAHYKMMSTLKNESDITVVLSGQGGDESLAGYNKYFFFNIKDLWRRGKYTEALKQAYYLRSRFQNEFKLRHAKRYVPILNKIIQKDNDFENLIKLDKSRMNLSAMVSLKQRQIDDIKHFSVPALCHYEDRNSMAHSLEIRLPFLDYRLVNFSINLSNEYKIDKGVNKRILRDSITELPRSIANRFDKKGFNVDEKGQSSSYFISYFEKQFENSALADLGVVDMDRLNSEIAKLKGRKSNIWERDLHRILFAELWAKRFL